MTAESNDRDKPDVDGARERLARTRKQRAEVDALVAKFMREQRANGFTANMTVLLRGGRS